MSSIPFYTILDKVVDGVHIECGYVQESPDNEMPAVINGEDVVFYEDMDAARAAYWDLVGR